MHLKDLDNYCTHAAGSECSLLPAWRRAVTLTNVARCAVRHLVRLFIQIYSDEIVKLDQIVRFELAVEQLFTCAERWGCRNVLAGRLWVSEATHVLHDQRGS